MQTTRADADDWLFRLTNPPVGCTFETTAFSEAEGCLSAFTTVRNIKGTSVYLEFFLVNDAYEKRVQMNLWGAGFANKEEVTVTLQCTVSDDISATIDIWSHNEIEEDVYKLTLEETHIIANQIQMIFHDVIAAYNWKALA